MSKFETLHDRLVYARKDAGYKTAKSFTEAHDIPYGRYRYHESGERTPSKDDVRRYASLLGVSYIWLLTGEGERKPALEPNIDHEMLWKSEERFGPSEEVGLFLVEHFKMLKSLSPEGRKKAIREMAEHYGRLQKNDADK